VYDLGWWPVTRSVRCLDWRVMAASGDVSIPVASKQRRSNAPRPGTLPHAAIEDYLKAIYQHTEWQDEPITTSALATRLDISPASVTGMIKKLVTLGLVEHEPYGPLALTHDGSARALSVIRRHRLIETWLVDEMHFAWDEVHDEAEVLEHSISDRLLDAIDARLKRPHRDPHGDPIPDAHGVVTLPPFRLLGDARPGEVGTVLRVSDRDASLLRLFAAHQIEPGAVLHVQGSDETTVAVATDHSDLVVQLPAEAALAVWITAPDTHVPLGH